MGSSEDSLTAGCQDKAIQSWGMRVHSAELRRRHAFKRELERMCHSR